MAMFAEGLGKLVEELGELQQVCGKKLAYFDTDNHPDGTNLRVRMEEEIGDVLAIIDFVSQKFKLNHTNILNRSSIKRSLYNQWDLED